MRSAIVAAGSLASLATALPSGMINVVNQCEASVQVTTHHNGGEGEPQGRFEKRDSYADSFREGTHEIRISPSDDPYEAGAPITGFVYSLKDDEVKYDLYNIFGFTQPSLSVKVEGDDKCEGVEIDNEEAVEGSETVTCSKDAAITLTLCPKEANM